MSITGHEADAGALFARAMQRDEAGDYTAGLAALTGAAEAGHLEAQFVLGRRLLFGWHAPQSWSDGHRWLDMAVRGGNAAAAELSAVMTGLGFGRVQDWRAAIALLERAAALGSDTAREQIALIAAAAAGAPDWIDRAAAWWTASAEAATLNEAPRAIAVRNLVSPDVCAWLIARAAPLLQRAQVYDGQRTYVSDTRTNRTASFDLLSVGLLHLLVQARIGAVIGAQIQQMEAFVVLNYGVGEEVIDHYDYLLPTAPGFAEDVALRGVRVATALLYLNDDYRGGVTDFPRIGLSHRGATGDLLLFFSVDGDGCPDDRSLHAGRPPLSGEKWVLSQFIRDKLVPELRTDA